MGPQIVGQVATDESVILGFEAEFMHEDHDYDDIFHTYSYTSNNWSDIYYEQITEATGWDDDRFRWAYYDDWLQEKKDDYQEEDGEQTSSEVAQDVFDENVSAIIAGLKQADPDKYSEHEDDEIEHDFFPEIEEYVKSNYSERFRQLYDETVNRHFSTGYSMNDCWDEMGDEERERTLEEMGIDTPANLSDRLEEGIHDIASQIEDFVGIKFEEVDAGYDTTNKHKDGWFLETDGDGPEIISAALPLPEQLDNLEETLEYIYQHGRTTSANGLHLNLSIEGKDGSDYDLMKLGLFLGEGYLLKQFGRQRNNNAFPQMEKLYRHILDLRHKYPQVRDWVKAWHQEHDDPEVAKAINDTIMWAFKGDKYRSFNVQHLANQGYIEFRIAGNEHYEKNWREVKETILRFAYVMKLATDPASQLKEYNKKLVKFFSNALEGDQLDAGMDAMDRYLYGIEHKMLPNHVEFATTEQYPRSMFRSIMKPMMFTKRPLETDREKVEYAKFNMQMLDHLHRDGDLKKHVKLYLKRFWNISGVPRDYVENMAGNMYEWGRDQETGLIKFRGRDVTKEDFLKQVDDYLDSLEK